MIADLFCVSCQDHGPTLFRPVEMLWLLPFPGNSVFLPETGMVVRGPREEEGENGAALSLPASVAYAFSLEGVSGFAFTREVSRE